MNLKLQGGSSAQRKLEVDAEMEIDDWSNENYQGLDKAVIDLITEMQIDPMLPSQHALLLSLIVSCSKGHLDPSFMVVLTVVKLIKDMPSLGDMLAEMWNKRKFKKIRNLSTFVGYSMGMGKPMGL